MAVIRLVSYGYLQPTRAEWNKFRRYSFWMRRLDVSADFIGSEAELLRMLSDNSPNGIMYPRLREFEWSCIDEPVFVPLCRYRLAFIVSPPVTDLYPRLLILLIFTNLNHPAMYYSSCRLHSVQSTDDIWYGQFILADTAGKRFLAGINKCNQLRRFWWRRLPPIIELGRTNATLSRINRQLEFPLIDNKVSLSRFKHSSNPIRWTTTPLPLHPTTPPLSQPQLQPRDHQLIS